MWTARALSGGDFILVDSESESRQISVRVYFPDMENRYLLSTTFRILSDSAETTATAVIQQLIAGPSNVGMNAVMPAGHGASQSLDQQWSLHRRLHHAVSLRPAAHGGAGAYFALLHRQLSV